MKKPNICKNCENEFFEKKFKKGFANECDDCSQNTEEPLKYIGFNDGSLNKAAHTSIYRGSNPHIRKSLNKKMGQVS